jgi:hypothetical protein
MTKSAEKFVVIEVPLNAAGLTEAMGTKPKFWYQDKFLGRCLFKQAREGTGEDWAEKNRFGIVRFTGIAARRI